MYNNDLQKTLHYLDDFVVISPSQSSAEHDKQTLISLWEQLGVPLETSKLEGPSQSLTFLGIVFAHSSLDSLKTNCIV